MRVGFGERPGMRKYLLLIALCVVFLVSGASAQNSLSYLLRVEGHAMAAETLERLVVLKLSPQWSKILRDPQSKEERRALAELLAAFAASGETGYKGKVSDYHTGRRLAVLESWKGKMQLHLGFQFVPDKRSRKYTLAGLERLAEVIGKNMDQKEQFMLTVFFDPNADKVERSALADHGSQVFLTLPASRDWNEVVVERVLRTGF